MDKVEELKIVEYHTGNSWVIRSNEKNVSKGYYKYLKEEHGGMYVKNLTNPETGERYGGYVYQKGKVNHDDLVTLVYNINNGYVEPCEIPNEIPFQKIHLSAWKPAKGHLMQLKMNDYVYDFTVTKVEKKKSICKITVRPNDGKKRNVDVHLLGNGKWQILDDDDYPFGEHEIKFILPE